MLLKTPISSNLTSVKLENAIAKLSSKLNEAQSSSLAISSNEIFNTVSQYFTEIAEAEFNPELILVNDTPSSEHYNRNLIAIHNDLKRFYEDLKNLTKSQVESYNYAQIVSQQILTKANSLASIVLDLNILNNFDRGDTIIAGDDFNTLDFIDLGAGLGSDQAETLPGGGGLSLARDSSIDIVDSNTKIEIIPIAPAGAGNAVTTAPTIGNIERFYEGNYYSFLGLARPEGGQFNFKHLFEPTANTTSRDDTSAVIVDLGASNEAKQQARLRMFDKDPSTFWECEFLYKIPVDGLSRSQTTSESEDVQPTSVITIDSDQANSLAKEFDSIGRDLVVDIILSFPETKSINFVSINPILFGPDAYPEIVDISTTIDDGGTFITVEGWESLKFAKFLTPEANELLTDSQQNAVLAPTRASYKGQGVFNFPSREAKKVKIRFKVDAPVASLYERVYALLVNNAKITAVTTTTTTKRSIF